MFDLGSKITKNSQAVSVMAQIKEHCFSFVLTTLVDEKSNFVSLACVHVSGADPENPERGRRRDAVLHHSGSICDQASGLNTGKRGKGPRPPWPAPKSAHVYYPFLSCLNVSFCCFQSQVMYRSERLRKH